MFNCFPAGLVASCFIRSFYRSYFCALCLFISTHLAVNKSEQE